MKLNKKAQNITKPYTIIFVIIIIAMFSISMWTFGGDIAEDPNNKLTNDSLLLIYNHYGFVPSINISSNDTTDLFYSSKLNTSGNTKDYALEFQFYREQSSSIRALGQDLFEVPSYFITNLGLDLSTWKNILFLWNTIGWVIIFYLIYRILRASI